MSAFSQATQSEVPLFQKQLVLESIQMTSLRLLTGAWTLCLEGFIIVQFTILHLATQSYLLEELTHEGLLFAFLPSAKVDFTKVLSYKQHH